MEIALKLHVVKMFVIKTCVNLSISLTLELLADIAITERLCIEFKCLLFLQVKYEKSKFR